MSDENDVREPISWSLEQMMEVLENFGATRSARASLAELLAETLELMEAANFEGEETPKTVVQGFLEFLSNLSPQHILMPKVSLAQGTLGLTWRKGENYCSVIFLPHGQYTYVYKQEGQAPVGGIHPYKRLAEDLRLVLDIFRKPLRPAVANTASPAFTKTEMLKILPVIVSDLKHDQSPQGRLPTNHNIRTSLYRHVIRELLANSRFGHREPMPQGGEGLFIKGLVRDVWLFLEEAYDLIHQTDFEREYAEVLLRKD